MMKHTLLMDRDLQIVNPLDDTGWNERVLSHAGCSFFHSSNWARVLVETYRYNPFYFVMTRDGTLQALMPFMEISSRLTGKRAVSLPFTDYCRPIVYDGLVFDDFLDAVIQRGKREGWESIELRTEDALQAAHTLSSKYCGHILDISLSEEELYRQLRDSTRRNIKKALMEGVEVVFGNSPDALKEFYRLNCMTRRDHGLPPQPYLFFKKIHEHVLANDLGLLALALYKGEYIAGAIYFHFNKQGFYKYGASDRAYWHMRANNLIMWEAIRRYRSKGYASFSFGRTEPENAGLLQFKAGWGARECPIYYYKYDLRKNAFVKDPLMLKGMHNRIFSKMPMPLLKIAGSLLYRHMG
jgi:Acetyltransferase (GNAT) domain